MKRAISLKVRQGFILVFLLVVALPVLFVSIGKAYYSSLETSAEQTLSAYVYSVISNVYITDGELNEFSPQIPELNNVTSLTYAYVYLNDKPAWNSDSAINTPWQPQINPDTLLAEPVFTVIEQAEQKALQVSLVFFMADNQGVDHKVEVFALRETTQLRELMQDFRETLIDWLMIMAVVITILMILGFIWSGRPLHKLDKEILAIEQGKADQLRDVYPVELHKIQEDLNLLLQSQQRQKDKYRASLSDLAHALKTPLAVLRSSPLASTPDAQEQLDRIAVMIEHQLKRAASGGTDTWKKRTPILAVVNSITNAMSKVYRDKAPNFMVAVDDASFFLGDKTDLLEMLGNLIDNACKACEQLVEIKVIQTNTQLRIVVGDDGPGVPEEKREQLKIRGQRLDTYEQGHGVGMAIVNDLVEAYQGELLIDTSPLGGAQFEIRFTYND